MYSLVAEVGIEPNLVAAYETAVCTSSSSPQLNLVAAVGIEPTPVGYQPTARPESFAAVELDSRLELLCHPYQRCGSPSILVEHNFNGARSENRTPVCRIRICRSAD
jgi:hypothetical protein